MEISQEDKERIEQEANSRFGVKIPERYAADYRRISSFIAGAEYEHKYQREQQAKELGEATENINYGSPEHLRYVIRKLKSTNDKLEAERSEVRNKVIEEAIEVINNSTLNIDWRQQLSVKLNSLKTK